MRSWEATLRMTSEALAHRKIPRLNAQQVLEAARESERAGRKRPEWQSLPARLKQQFSAAAERLAADLGESSVSHGR